MDVLTSILADPGVSSLVGGAVSGISSLANNPQVTSAVGSVISVISSGGPTPAPGQESASASPTGGQAQPGSTANGTPSLSPTGSSGPSEPTGSPSLTSGSGALQTRLPDGSEPKKSTNIGAIVGGVVGGVVLLALIAGLLWWLCRRKKKRQVRKKDDLFEDQDFVQTPGVVDPYSSGSRSLQATTMTSSSGFHSFDPSSTSLDNTNPSYMSDAGHSYVPGPAPVMTKAQMAAAERQYPAGPMSVSGHGYSRASIPNSIPTTAGTFGPRLSTDTGYSGDDSYGVARSNTMTSTASRRPLPTVPLSPMSPTSPTMSNTHTLANGPPPVPPPPGTLAHSNSISQHPGMLSHNNSISHHPTGMLAHSNSMSHQPTHQPMAALAHSNSMSHQPTHQPMAALSHNNTMPQQPMQQPAHQPMAGLAHNNSAPQYPPGAYPPVNQHQPPGAFPQSNQMLHQPPGAFPHGNQVSQPPPMETVVEHAVDAGKVPEREVLPPMYNPQWNEQQQA